MFCHHGAQAKPACGVHVRGIEANKIAVVDEFTAGLAAGVETCIAPGALAVKGQQAKALDRAASSASRRRAESQCSRIISAQRQEFVGKRRR